MVADETKANMRCVQDHDRVVMKYIAGQLHLRSTYTDMGGKPPHTVGSATKGSQSAWSLDKSILPTLHRAILATIL